MSLIETLLYLTHAGVRHLRTLYAPWTQADAHVRVHALGSKYPLLTHSIVEMHPYFLRLSRPRWG
jgi:hypothetical protein